MRLMMSGGIKNMIILIMADEGPFHKAGLRTYTLDRWVVNERSYSVMAKYSDQSMMLD
jgi:hypothetical protein